MWLTQWQTSHGPQTLSLNNTGQGPVKVKLQSLAKYVRTQRGASGGLPVHKICEGTLHSEYSIFKVLILNQWITLNDGKNTRDIKEKNEYITVRFKNYYC